MAQDRGVNEDTAFAGSGDRYGGGPLAEEGEEARPPPYESVLMSDSAPSASGGPSQAPQASPPQARPQLEILVKDPVKQGKDMSAFMSYKVVTAARAPGYSRHSEVIRRYRDFAWLHDRLQDRHKGIIVPPLPEKNPLNVNKLTPNSLFIEKRRAALTKFINCVAQHPALAGSRDLQQFLQASEEDWAHEVARVEAEAAGGKPAAVRKLASTLELFRSLGHTTQNLLGGRSDDEEEDPEYLKVRQYMAELEGHLGDAHRQAQRLLHRQGQLGAALADFGLAMVGLGKLEAGSLAENFITLGQRAEDLAKSAVAQADALTASFEAPLYDFVRLVRSARGVMGARSSALASLQAARSEVEARRARLFKLRGTPGAKEERRAEAERELNEAQHRVEAAKEVYEQIVREMSTELQRFQRQRATDLAAVLKNFATAQAKLAAENAQGWRSLAPTLTASNGVT